MIDQATIDRILDAAQIVDVVSEFVTLRRRGVNYIGLCPFHNEKTPSFSVSPSKGLCKCFSCGKGGNVVTSLWSTNNFLTTSHFSAS
jgi:DNA primase